MFFLKVARAKFKFDLLDSENHQSIILRNIPDALQSFYSGLSYEIKDYKTFQLDLLKEHYFKLSQKYGYTIKIPEVRLILIGIEMIKLNYYLKAEEVLLYCTSLYPSSKSAKFNLLGEVYSKLEDIEKAVLYYEKDLETYPNNEWTKNKLKEIRL